jgi:hypothetical protein
MTGFYIFLLTGKLFCNNKKNCYWAFRKTPGNRNYRELLRIIEMRCEENRVSFRSVNPYKTGQICTSYSHTERGNRVCENFRCLKCGYSGRADIVGALDILTRFTTGQYGAGFKIWRVVSIRFYQLGNYLIVNCYCNSTRHQMKQPPLPGNEFPVYYVSSLQDSFIP